MQYISFNDGYKTYAINGDENCFIRINPSDFSILGKIEKAKSNIEKFKIDEPTAPEEAAAAANKLDTAIREQIDFIFGEGISKTVFGSLNCVSLAGGKPIYQNFLDALLPVIEADIAEEKKKSDENIRRYTSQIK